MKFVLFSPHTSLTQSLLEEVAIGLEANNNAQKDPAAILEIKEDIREECARVGDVTNVVLFDKEPDGVASVRFANPEDAKACVRVCPIFPIFLCFKFFFLASPPLPTSFPDVDKYALYAPHLTPLLDTPPKVSTHTN